MASQVRGNLLEATQRLKDAAIDYRRVLALRPSDMDARANLQLCEELLQENGDGPSLKPEIQKALLMALRQQKRLTEAAPLSSLLKPDAESAEF